MSILSTNQKLIRVGTEYSAGRDIDITSGVISYTGDNGREYSAGENIGIDNYTISSRNWTPDITYAAESAFQRATGYTDTQISALSGEVSAEVSQLGSDIEYISGVALTAHQSLEGYLTKASGDEYYQPLGSYATVSQLESTSGEIVNLIPTDYVNTETLEQTSGNIVNLIPDTSEFITNSSAEQTYQHIGNYLSSNALEGYATQDWVNEQGYITGVDLSNYYTKNETSGADELENAFANIPLGDEEVNELVHSNSGEWNNVSAKLDSTAFSTVSGDFLTAVPDEYATKDFVSNSISSKLDISSFSSVSGDFLTNEDLNGYATEQWVGEQGYLTVVSIPESANWEEATNAYEQNSGSYLTGLPNDVVRDSAFFYEITETGSNLTKVYGNYIHSLSSDYATYAVQASATHYDEFGRTITSTYQTKAGMTAYQPAGSYATTNELEQVSADITATIPSTAGLASESYVQTNSAVLTGMIDGKQDTLTFGYDEQDRINSINSSALAGGGTGGDPEVNAYVTNNSATLNGTTDLVQNSSGLWNDVAVYQSNSANYLTAHQDISYKLDESAFADVSGTFLTAHQDLSDYQTTAGMTAYMTTGDSAEFMTTAERSDYIPTGVSSEFYTTANTAGYISTIPDTYLQNTDLSTTDGKVTAISGIPLSAGGDVPEGVMVESALEYNAVNEISGYNGSAIAQYGAEKQWLVHDDTLVHAANSAQYALGVNVSALQRLMGIDETVLWSGELSVGQTATLSEDYSAFRKLEFKYRTWSVVQNGQMKYEQFGTDYGNWQTLAGWQANNLKAVFIGAYSATDANHIKLTSASYNNITATNAWVNASDNYRLFEIRGIGRKEV